MACLVRLPCTLAAYRDVFMAKQRQSVRGNGIRATEARNARVFLTCIVCRDNRLLSLRLLIRFAAWGFEGAFPPILFQEDADTTEIATPGAPFA
jgi:hypothetical protein